MRDIKFRAWDQDHKCWRFGWLTKLVEGVRCFFAIICHNSEADLVRYYIHDSETIGQFTGLKDKNGKEIYEGDIVNVLNYLNGEIWEGHTHHDEVIFSGGRFNIKNPWCHESLQSNTVVVIGNIHETPELLEAAK